MLKKFNHVAIAVNDLEKSSNIYKHALNAKVSDIVNYKDHGVSVVFIELENCKIELMQPFGDNSPISSFLKKNMNGGIHHICIEVTNIIKTKDDLEKKGFTILGDGKPKIGAHDKPVIFLHPKEFNGTLIELEQE